MNMHTNSDILEREKNVFIEFKKHELLPQIPVVHRIFEYASENSPMKKNCTDDV